MTSKHNSGRFAATLIGALSVCSLIQPAFAQNVVLTLDEGPCQVPLQANSSVTVDSTSGDLTLDVDDGNLPECFGSTSGDAVNVVITVDPATVQSGETVDVSWSVEGFVAGAVTCTPVGGTADWRAAVQTSPAGGSGTFTPTTNPTNFTINCQTSAQVAVTVEGGGTGGNNGIDGFPDPPGFCNAPGTRALSFNISKDFANNPPDGQPKVNYEGVWGVWPGSNEATVFVPKGQYVAMPFYANEPVGKVWSMTWVGGPSNGQATQVSISRCPGDFSGIGFTDTRCLVSSGSEGATMATIIGAGNACPLVGGANEIYYLNVRHTNSTGQDACNEPANCGFLGQPSRLN